MNTQVAMMATKAVVRNFPFEPLVKESEKGGDLRAGVGNGVGGLTGEASFPTAARASSMDINCCGEGLDVDVEGVFKLGEGATEVFKILLFMVTLQSSSSG